MNELIALVNQFGPAVGGFLLIAGGFWLQSRSLNLIAAANSRSHEAMSEIATTSTVELRERNDRIGTLESSILAEREINHQKTLRIVELEGVLTTTTLTLGQREHELAESREANGALRAAKDELKQQLTTLSRDVGELTSKLEELEAALAEEKEHSGKLGDRLDKMEADLEEARRLREKAERLNGELTAERDRLAEDNRLLTEQVAQYKEEVRLLREQLKALEARIEGMIDHVDESDEMVGGGGSAGDAAGADGGGGGAG